ncbi:MAG: YhbY family RNA-binding protein [Metallosphaera sp.]|nr:YhbY family RNA-binding protein [Metallosphaera cuprina]
MEGAEVRIGKKGFTHEMKEEISRHLKDHKVVKVKIINKSLGRKEVAEAVAKETESELVEIRGRTFILRKNDSA